VRLLILSDQIPPENKGGAGEVAWRLAHFAQQAGHEVHVACATSKRAFETVKDGIHVYAFHSQYHERWRAMLSLYNPQTARPLQALYHRLKPDVVNAHNVHTHLSYYSLRMAHRMGIKTVFTAHDVMSFAYTKLTHFITPDACEMLTEAYRLPLFYNLKTHRLRYNPLRNPIIASVLKQDVDDRVAVSQALADALHANGLPPFRVVHNGIDAEQWQATPEGIHALRQHLGLEGRKVVLFAGRLSAVKGTRPLLDALNIVRQSIPNVTLLVLSSMPIEAQVTDSAYTELRQNHIVSGGWMSGSDLVNAYALADVVVTPSLCFDSFPTINLEGMATHTPVITTCFGGGKEAVEDGITGYVLNPYQTDIFAQRLTQLLMDEALAKRMGEAGYQRVLVQFSGQKMLNAVFNHSTP